MRIVKESYGTNIFEDQNKDIITELVQILNTEEYPPDEIRKINRPQKKVGKGQPKAKSQVSARRIIRKRLDSALSRNWRKQIDLHSGGRIPSMKLHYLRERVGLIISMQHRTSIGTDLIRLEVANRHPINLIDLGIFICGTKGFEEYYFGTEKKSSENMIIFEEVKEYLNAIGNIISVPLIIIGIESP